MKNGNCKFKLKLSSRGKWSKENEPREAVVSVDPEGNRLHIPDWLVIKFPVDDEVRLKEILTNTPSSAPNAKMSIAL